MHKRCEGKQKGRSNVTKVNEKNRSHAKRQSDLKLSTAKQTKAQQSTTKQSGAKFRKEKVAES